MLRQMQLSPEGARVLGALVEKGLATPQQYPLTVNALQAACNQSSNREPVVTYDETTVLATLDELKDQKLVRFVLPSHGRSVTRYRQVLDEMLGIDDRQCAILAVLLLRGPQTIGELRIRSERMARFENLAEVEHELELLDRREDPLVRNAGRRPGQKEERWATTLTAEPEAAPAAAAAGAGPDGHSSTDGTGGTTDDDAGDGASDLRAEVDELRAEVGDLRRELEMLRESLGG
jgi:uncharacterized protein